MKQLIAGSTKHRADALSKRLRVANMAGPYLLTDTGFVSNPLSTSGFTYLRTGQQQTESLPPTLCEGELHCTIELRNRRGFKGFHESHKGRGGATAK